MVVKSVDTSSGPTTAFILTAEPITFDKRMNGAAPRVFRRTLSELKTLPLTAIDLTVDRVRISDWLVSKPRQLTGSNLLLLADVDSSSALFPLVRSFGCDYLIKPVRMDELVVRMSFCALKSRAERTRRLLAQADQDLRLTRTEERILTHFLSEAEFTVSREFLIKAIWPHVAIGVNTVDVHIFNLRKKLRAKGFKIVVCEGMGTWKLLSERETE